MRFTDRLQHAWNVFRENDKHPYVGYPLDLAPSWPENPDRPRFNYGVERSIVNSIYNRIAIDVASVPIKHVRLGVNGKFESVIESDLNYCLTVEANIDQTGRSFIQDIVISLCDEGVVAVVPVDTDVNPETGTFKIKTLRVGKILEWRPQMVKVRIYNELRGEKEDIWVEKRTTAIIENPLYSVMNEPNSTVRRLTRKLNILDAIDEQSGAGKLDLIIQLPYVIKTPERRKQAELRRKDIEMQLSGTKYGIAYTDGTERITQLNRPAENNLLTQIEYLTNEVYGQLGMSEKIFDGTASEEEKLDYHNRTIEPFLAAITNEMDRKYLTKTARSQRQAVIYIQNPFRLIPTSQLAELADKFIRNKILTANEFRGIIGYQPSDDPDADRLKNPNLNEEKGANTEPEISVTEDISENVGVP